jgi:hypothetical protein
MNKTQEGDSENKGKLWVVLNKLKVEKGNENAVKKEKEHSSKK